ncbi:MAG: hypothetical protein GXY88_05145 [Tissierellia bacterium]|nr:hypothetical protein [Tissierellia bacterium]
MYIIFLTRFLSNQDLELLRILGLGFRIILISVYPTIPFSSTLPAYYIMAISCE